MKKPNFKSNTEKLNQIHDDSLNTFSAQDCTGLIPSAVKNEGEIESYEEIYPYRASNDAVNPQQNKIQ